MVFSVGSTPVTLLNHTRLPWTQTLHCKSLGAPAVTVCLVDFRRVKIVHFLAHPFGSIEIVCTVGRGADGAPGLLTLRVKPLHSDNLQMVSERRREGRLRGLFVGLLF